MTTKARTSSRATALTTASNISPRTSTPVPALPPAVEAVPIAMAQASRATRAATPAPLQQVQSFQILVGQWAARSSGNAATTAALLPQSLSPDVWQEMLQMQAAVLGRLQQQQKNWASGLSALALEYQQGKRANTMSKLVEQQFNLVAQFGQLLSKQATDLVGLQENLEVDYGFWVAQKLGH